MKILLGVTGSISCYKAYDLARLFVNEGHQVKVVLTSGALKFIKAETFNYLGCLDTYTSEDDFTFKKSAENSDDTGTVLHINLVKWADTFVAAPLSANTLAKLANGLCDDLLTSAYLAWPSHKPISLFPAMNQQMLHHPAVQENIFKCKKLPNVMVAQTHSGKLACGDIGEGKLLSVEQIKALTLTNSIQKKDNSSKKVLLLAGATVTPLDSVRYLTNASTGITAIPFIEHFLYLGYNVQLLKGRFSSDKLNDFEGHPQFESKTFTDTNSLFTLVKELFPVCDIYISSAAIGDIEFPISDSKLKKSSLGETLPIKKSQDILSWVLSEKKDNQKIIGFAAESELTNDVLKEKISKKPVDLLIGTQVHNGIKNSTAPLGFGVNQATYRFATKDQTFSELEQLTKIQMVQRVLPFITGEGDNASLQ